MPVSKFLAIDIGAESGRVIVGILDNGKFSLNEIHRFPNKQITKPDGKYWDVPDLFREIKRGIKLASENGHTDIESIGIDTWGVDFGFIGKDNNLLKLPHTYRDPRTNEIKEKVFEKIPQEELYSITGIQFLPFNSLFQLYCDKMNNSEIFNHCQKILFMPDLFNYFLTGKLYSEYTIASSSQMLNVITKNWDERIFRELELPLRIMPQLIQPGTTIGKLSEEILKEFGLKKEVDVIAVGCHDTASAVAAVPASNNNWAFISSGTWSVIGIESDKPIVNNEALINDFANEGGINNKILFLKNVMGMWLIQEAKKIFEREGKTYSYNQLIETTSCTNEFKYIINPDDNLFLNPQDMTEAIRSFCIKTNQPKPESTGEYIRCILESLALKYNNVLEKINSISNKKVEALHIVGGGSQNDLLNQFTADSCGIPVISGPVEATALGNILVQAIAKRKIPSIEMGRNIIAGSFSIKKYLPENSVKWKTTYETYKNNF
jgi:rhamnulokinase